MRDLGFLASARKSRRLRFMNLNLHGILPPIPTPFDRGEVAHDKLAANVRKLCSTGVHGLLVLGSNGEYVYLSEADKRQVVKGVLRGILRRAELLP